jgi:hypothetical protein
MHADGETGPLMHADAVPRRVREAVVRDGYLDGPKRPSRRMARNWIIHQPRNVPFKRVRLFGCSPKA